MNDRGLYELDGNIKIREGFPFAIQQVLSMFLSNVTPALLITAVAVYNGNALTSKDIALILQNAMIVAGIGTLIQGFPIWKLGAKLPVIMGISFNFLACGMVIAADDYGYLMGAVLIGGICEGILGLCYKYWGRFISPVTSGCVVIAIGFSIIGSACNSIASSDTYATGSIPNIVVGFITMLIAMVIYIKGKGLVKELYLLIGLVAGYILSAFFGMLDFSSFTESVNQLGIVAIPSMFAYKPKFNLGYIATVVIVFCTSAAETVGDITVLTKGALDREPTEKEITGGLGCDGFISALSGGVFGCTPITSFSGQIGTVIMTRIVNRKCILIEGLILIVAGLLPPVGALLTTIPACVLGGVSVIAFGFILVSGIKMLGEVCKDNKNTLIVAVSLTLGIGSTLCEDFYSMLPDTISQIFAGNPIAGVFFWAVLLTAVFPDKAREKSV